MKKTVAVMLALILMLAPAAIYAESIGIATVIDLDDVDEEEKPVDEDEAVIAVDDEASGPPSIKGKTPLYKTKIKMMTSTGKAVNLRYARDTNSKSLGLISAGKTVTIYEVDPSFVLIEYEGKVGYILRTCIDENCTAIDPVNTSPYGVAPCHYVATTTQKTEIYKSKNTGGDHHPIVIGEGAQVAILGFEDGFAKVIYWRSYGFIPANRLTDLIMVSATEEPMSEETPIAAFSSFFAYGNGKALNDGRVKNIMRSCETMSRVMQPGEVLDFNNNVGPWKYGNGYFDAPVLVNGETQAGVGGGTCQSSSTMYNVIRQLPRITVLYRRPHGPGCARYLPQHTDAAVGNDKLNLIFRNDYEFPIRIDAVCNGVGVLTIKIYKA